MPTSQTSPRIDADRVSLWRVVPACLWSIMIALFFSTLFTVEWTFAGCVPRSDALLGTHRPMAAYGFPLPFAQGFGYFSGEFSITPSVYYFDLFILGVAAFPFVRWFLEKQRSWQPRWRGFATLVRRSLLFVCIWCRLAADLRPVADLKDYDRALSLSDYRPVDVGGMNYRGECTPSAYWFGSGGKAQRP